MTHEWWETFFDAEYLEIWGGFTPDERSEVEAAGIWSLLQLSPRSRVLDAPCGYGRISRRLAARGAAVVGVDQSDTLLDFAERQRLELPFSERLRYLRHDLRLPIGLEDFDAAINVFSSLGYGTALEDVSILRNLRNSLRPRGSFFLETNHRDAVVLTLADVKNPSLRLPDGTLVFEEPRFDPVAGEIQTTWHWSGPRGQGSKSASMRVYCISELVQLVEAAGFEFVSAHRGCSPEPFPIETGELRARVGILCRRAD